MSKKCCGIIYSDSDTVCRICGKTLTDNIEDDEYEKLREETDKVVADVMRMTNEQAERPLQQGDGLDMSNVIAEMNDLDKESDKDTADDGDVEDIDAADGGDAGDADAAVPRTPVSLKICGILALAAAVCGMAVIVLCVIFLIFFPVYDRSSSDGGLTYPNIATSSDAHVQSVLLTPTDAELGIYFDDTDKTASDTDAQSDGAESTETADDTQAVIE